MPLYDVQCTKCGLEFEHLCKIAEATDISCTKCDGKCKTLITGTSRDWFRPHWNPNLDIDPVFVKSKDHFKQLCLERGLTSRALGDVRNITEI